MDRENRWEGMIQSGLTGTTEAVPFHDPLHTICLYPRLVAEVVRFHSSNPAPYVNPAQATLAKGSTVASAETAPMLSMVFSAIIWSRMRGTSKMA